MAKKSGLGKGLSALIPQTASEEKRPDDQFFEISVDLLDPNPEQPRHQFHEDQLRELADSIKHNGVIQPIIVTRGANGRYIVIAGERRWRATMLAGYERIPAIIRKVEKGQMLSLALLENIQRQELNPIEEALAYNKLLDDNNFTHDSLASRLGKSRVTITNTVRLLKLPSMIKNMIQDQKLSFGHARCLVAIDDQDYMMRLAGNCIDKHWSVRELERRIQQDREKKNHPKTPKPDKTLKETAKRISNAFKSKVSIAGDGKKGKISISYNSDAEFDRIVAFLMNEELSAE
ncbi:MAG: ParB/RepB/Spo0J family partition protein [Acidobacteriota bacterium]|nr:ParB/RepB/Spo0J family partition protein [Acidobacteriota bacterium]